MKHPAKAKLLFTYAACLMLTVSVPASTFAAEPIESNSSQTTSESQMIGSEPTQVETTAQAPTDQTTYTYDASQDEWTESQSQVDPESGSYQQITSVPVQSQANGNSTSTNDTSTTSTNNSQTNTSINNMLDSFANTGNATVSQNGSAGNATSGNASVNATVINNVNSTVTNGNNKEAATFVKDIVGDVNGDIMLQSSLLKAMLEANTANSQSNTIKSTTNTTLTNDLNMSATSGNATVSQNGKAGSATTGSANAVADVVNIVNSMVAANQSFNGTINIYGNLNGDILIAPDFIPQMLANNGANSTYNSSNSTTNITKVDVNDTQEIVNNVTLAAESGAALISNNGKAGNATTGDAKTNLVIFNLSGHEIVAKNSLLVFVNVLGSWVGVIVDAPQGTTAAAIGDGVTKNTASSMTMDVNADNNTTITNNINLNAQSGDATVTENGSAGNATTGNATASANIANISNSSVGLSGWFGILFINVFGSWNGSFGVDTAAGNPPTTIGNGQAGNENEAFMSFVPRDQRVQRASVQRFAVVTPGQSNETTTNVETNIDNGEVKGTSDTKNDMTKQTVQPKAYEHNYNIPLIIGSIVLILGSVYALRRILF